MSELSHTFKLHEHEESPYNSSFLSMAVTTMVPIERETFDHLAQLSDSWRNVELGCTVNGVSVSAQALMASLERTMDIHIDRGVAETLQEMTEVNELRESLDQLQASLREQIHGIPAKRQIPGHHLDN